MRPFTRSGRIILLPLRSDTPSASDFREFNSAARFSEFSRCEIAVRARGPMSSTFNAFSAAFGVDKILGLGLAFPFPLL
jgi:hypothetical protein